MPDTIPAGFLYHEIHERHPEKPWMVLVHGAGGSVRTWKYQVDAFKPHFNLLLLDLRDHGNSQNMPAPADGKYTFELMAREIVALMELRGIQRAHFVGVSMGSIVVRWLEFLFPERIDKIVLAGGVFKLNFKLKWGLKLGIFLSKLISYRLMSRILSFIIMPRRNHQKARGIFLREADRIPTEAFKRWVNMARTVGKELDLFYETEMTVPTLAVMGAQDHVFLPPAKDYAAQNALVELEVIPKCGHVCNIEAHETFNRKALAYLGAVSGRPIKKIARPPYQRRPDFPFTNTSLPHSTAG